MGPSAQRRFMFNIGPLEIAVIALLALLVVGPKRLPEVGKMVAKSLRQFRDVQDEFKKSIDLGDLMAEDKPPSFDKPPTSRMAAGAAAAEADFVGRGRGRRGPGPSETPEGDDADEDLDDTSAAEALTGTEAGTTQEAPEGTLDERSAEASDEGPASPSKPKRTWDADDGATEDDHQ